MVAILTSEALVILGSELSAVLTKLLNPDAQAVTVYDLAVPLRELAYYSGYVILFLAQIVDRIRISRSHHRGQGESSMPRIKLNWVGEVVAGRYRIEAELGEGGMGTVYSALDLQSNGRVAIKTPRIALLEDPQFFKRFEREMKALQQLRHPHLVPVLDVGTHNRIPFFVMPYLGGGNLHQRFQKKRASRLQDLFPWLAQLASALDYLHQHKLVHRDVKPANVLFDEQQTAYLTDLGAVKVQEGSELDAKTKLTQTGTALGTPAYMAPEVLFGEPFDGRCDQYSLAAIVYEAFAGRLPHQGRTLPELIQSHFKTQPERLEKLCRVPVGVADAVARALARDPKQRFASCLEFVRAVQEGFSRSAQVQATQPVAPEPRVAPTVLVADVQPPPIQPAQSPLQGIIAAPVVMPANTALPPTEAASGIGATPPLVANFRRQKRRTGWRALLGSPKSLMVVTSLIVILALAALKKGKKEESHVQQGSY